MDQLKEYSLLNTVERLKGLQNYNLWKFQITVLLESNGSLNVVTGAARKPRPAEDTDGKLLEAWLKKDACGKKMLILTIDRSLQSHIMNYTTANQMWSKICEMFEKKGELRKNKLLQAFYSAQYEKGTSIIDHVSKIENLYHQLKEVDPTMNERMVVNKILCTLPERLNTFKTMWEMNDALEQTLSNLTSRLLTEEDRSKPGTSAAEVAFFADDKNKKPKNHRKNSVQCFRCKGYGHKSFECERNKNTNKNNNGNKNYTCSICKHPTSKHTEASCFFRKRDNEDKNEKKVCFMTRVDGADNSRRLEWLLDSGSSKHMTNDISLLVNIKKMDSEIGIAKQDSYILSKAVGTLVAKECNLENVLYVPDLARNLLSVDAIVECGGLVKFSNNSVSVTKNGDEILKGFRDESGGFLITLTTAVDKNCAFLASKTETAYEWHEKLGHLSGQNIKKLIELSDGLDVSQKELLEVTSRCDVCIKAKQTRNSFGDERTAAKRPLEIIHSDLCGPITPQTWDGMSYFATFKDDFTGFTQVYLLAHKSELLEVFRQYVAEVESKWNLKVHSLRSDRGGEYSSNQLIAWCKTKGIVRDLAPAKTPELNGTAERVNRTIVEKIRAMLISSGVDKNLWGECCYVSVFLANRSPHKNHEKTPYENWHGRPPSMKRLQIFGSRAFVKKLGHLKKLEDRSEEFIFVGYTNNSYRLFDKNNRRIVLSRDVTFKKAENLPKTGLLSDDGAVLVLDDLENENAAVDGEGNENGNTAPGEEEEDAYADGDSFLNLSNSSIEDTIVESSDWQPADTDSELALDLTPPPPGETRYPDRERKEVQRFQAGQSNLAFLTKDEEPMTTTEALSPKNPNKDKWLHAMTEELNSLEKNKTWELTDLPKEKMS